MNEKSTLFEACLVKDWQDLPSPIGVFGGTFDPIQNGHLMVAKNALASGKVRSLVFIPAKLNPLKTVTPLASAIDRMNMIALAINNESEMKVSDIEVNRAGSSPSYTYETIVHIKSICGNKKIFFVFGTDCLSHLHKWYRISELISLLDGFVVYPRDGDAVSALNELTNHFSAEEASKLKEGFLEMDSKEVSSAKVKKLLKENNAVEALIPAAVKSYIDTVGLYRERCL